MVSPIPRLPQFGGVYIHRTENDAEKSVDYKVDFVSQKVASDSPSQDDLELDEVVFIQGKSTEAARLHDPRIKALSAEIHTDGIELTTDDQQRLRQTLRDVVRESDAENPFKEEFLSAQAVQQAPFSQKPVAVAGTHWFTQRLSVAPKKP